MSLSIAELGLKIDATPLDAFNSKMDATIEKAGRLQAALSSFNMSSSVTQSIEAIDKAVEKTTAAMNAKFASLGTQRIAQDAMANATILANQTAHAAKIDALMTRYIERANDISARRLQMEQRNTDSITAMYRRMFDEIARNEAIAQATFSRFGSSSASNTSPATSNNSFASVSGLSQQTTATQALSSATRDLGNSANNARSHYDELHRILAKTHDMLIRMAAYRMISIVAGAPAAILDVNVRMESLRVQLEGITGSAGQAKAVFKELLALDIKTPFDIEGLAQTWIRLKNYGLEPTKEVMKSLTDGVARLGGGTDILNRVSLQLGQAWAKNKLQLQDMKPMMDAGIPVLSLLADAYHTNAGAILEMSHAGTLGHDAQMKLISAIEKWSSGAAIRAMDTLKGQISNVSTSWIQFQDALLNTKGENAVKGIFKGISDALFSAIKYIDEIITSITILASVLGVKMVESLIIYANKQRLANAAAVEGAAAFSTLSLTTKMLNAALIGLVGWEIGTYLNKFETIRRVANDNLYAVLVLVENVAYGYERLSIAMSDATRGEKRQAFIKLKEAHIEALKPLEDLISADNTYAKGTKEVTEAVKYKNDAAKKDLELAEQSEKAINAQVKALEALQRVNKAIADAENARIDAKAKTVGILAGLSVKQYEDEYKANQDSFKNLDMSQDEYYNKQMQLIEAIKNAKLKAIDDETNLLKTKTNVQIEDASKAIDVIRKLESESKNQSKFANTEMGYGLGKTGALASTLTHGYEGLPAFGPAVAANLESSKTDFKSMSTFLKENESGIEEYMGKLHSLLMVQKGVSEGTRLYLEGTSNLESENFDKFKSMYADSVGFTQKQIALDQTQMEKELEKNKVIEEAKKNQSKLTQQLTLDEDNLVKALKAKYETPNEKATSEINRLIKLRDVYDESVFPMKLYNQALIDIEANRVKDNKAIAESLNHHKELDSILKNLNKETLNAGKGDRSLYMINARDSIVDAAIRDNKSLLDLEWQMDQVSDAYDRMITAKQTAAIVNTLKDGFAQGFKDILSGAESFGSAFKNVFDNVIGKIIDNSLQNLMTGFEKVFDGIKGGWGQVLSSLAVLGASAITSLFGKKQDARQLSSSEVGNSPVLGTGAMHIADTFSRDLGYEYQSQTIIRFNDNLKNLSSGLITGIKAGFEQFGATLVKLPVISSVMNFIKPVTNFISGLYTSISNFITTSITTGTTSLITTADYAAANIAASANEMSGLMDTAPSQAMKTAGQVLAVVGAMYTAFNYFTGLGDMIKRGNVVEMISSTGMLIGSVVAMFNPLIGGIIMAVSALVGLFSKPRIPNAWMNTYNPDQSGAPLIDRSYAENVAETGNKSATLTAYTPFGSVAISTHEASLTVSEMNNAFGALLKTVKNVDINLYNTVNRLDAAMGQTGKTMDFYNRTLVGNNRVATKQDMSALNAGNMLSERYTWIVDVLGRSGSVVGQYINAWFDVITNKFVTVSQSNSMFVLGVIDSLANNIESFMQFPLGLVNLIGQSVKSTSMGGTPDSVMAEISGVFDTYLQVQSGLAALGMGGNQSTINERIVLFLTDVNRIGFAVKDAGVNLLAYAIAMQKVTGNTIDAVSLLNDANNKLSSLKSQGLDNAQITAYIGSFGLMANLFAESKVVFTSADLDYAASNIHKLAQSSVEVAKNTVDHAIANEKLTNVTRESAIATLIKNKTLDEATVAESEYGVSMAKTTKEMLSNLAFIQQIGFTAGKSLGEMGISAGVWQNAASNIVNVFGDLETAMKSWDNIAKTFLSSSDYASYNLNTINRSLANMAEINPNLALWFTPEMIAASLKSGQSMADYINILASGNGELANESFSYIDLVMKRIEAEKSLQSAMQDVMQTYNDLTAWLNKDKRGTTSGTNDFARNTEYLSQLNDLYGKALSGDSASVSPLLSLVDEYKGFLQKYSPATFSQISEGIRTAILTLQDKVGIDVGVLPSHATGLDSVPYDGYVAKLHKGERVLTSSESRNYSQKDDTATVDMLIELIKTEREGFKQVINELKQANRNTSDMKASSRRKELKPA